MGAVFLGVTGLCVLGIGLIVLIVGLATPDWDVVYVQNFQREQKVSAGLWMICAKDVCSPYSRLGGAILLCDFSAIVASLLGVLGLGFAIYELFLVAADKVQSPKTLEVPRVTGWLALILVLKIVIIWSVYIHRSIEVAEETINLNANLGFSFFLSLIGGILMAIGGTFFVYVASRKTSETPLLVNE